jgi:hypothetical protein
MFTGKKVPSKKAQMERSCCCVRFAECVARSEILRSPGFDETEWFVDGWLHLYYCPFCGKNIKGAGFGTYDKEHGTTKRKGHRGEKGGKTRRAPKGSRRPLRMIR